MAPVVIKALVPTLDKSLKSDRFLCPVRALRYYLDRTSGRTRSWSLSPLRKVLTRTSDLQISPHGSNRLSSYVMSSLIRMLSPYIRLKPMMSGPLLLLRSSSRESPWSKSHQPATGSHITPSHSSIYTFIHSTLTNKFLSLYTKTKELPKQHSKYHVHKQIKTQP